MNTQCRPKDEPYIYFWPCDKKAEYLYEGYKYKGKKVVVIPASSGKSIGIYYNDVLIEDILLEK